MRFRKVYQIDCRKVLCFSEALQSTMCSEDIFFRRAKREFQDRTFYETRCFERIQYLLNAPPVCWQLQFNFADTERSLPAKAGCRFGMHVRQKKIASWPCPPSKFSC